MYITWSDDLNVGDPELDAHHRSIVDAIAWNRRWRKIRRTR